MSNKVRRDGQRRRRSRALLLLSALGGVAAGCQILAGLDGDFHAAGPSDAGTDAGPTGCVGADYPGPPGGDDEDAGTPPLIFAVRTVDIGDLGTTPGYDLDHVCTCFDDAGPTCVSAKAHCDAPGGIDNGAADLLGLLTLATSSGQFSSAFYSQTAEEGDWTMLVRVTGYNGQADDPSIVVDLFPSHGMGGATPTWSGDDAWPVVESSVEDGGVPLFRSEGAYVSGGVLVAAMPRAKLILGAQTPFAVSLTGGVITAQITRSSASWKLTKGVLAGRWALSDVFRAFSGLRIAGKPLCTDDVTLYGAGKAALCTGADIRADGTSAKSLPCDALSFGIGFTADPAQIGAPVPEQQPEGGCPPETDPANDSCGP